MESSSTSLRVAVGTVRWLARGLSLVSICFLALFVFGEPPTPARVTAAQALALVFFPLGVAVGMALAWKWEGVGSALGLISLAVFYVLNGLFLSGGFSWWFTIFSLPLVLFLIAWAATRIRARRDISSQ